MEKIIQTLSEEELDCVTGGLANGLTSERERVQIRSLDQDNRNIQTENKLMKLTP